MKKGVTYVCRKNLFIYNFIMKMKMKIKIKRKRIMKKTTI